MTRVLVLRALGVGDLLVSVPALRGLRAAFPEAAITVAVPDGLTELAGLTGAIDEVLPTKGLGELAWPGPPPSVAVNLHGSGPESTRALFATRPGRLLTHAHPGFPALDGPKWTEGVREVDRWCRLLGYYDIPADPDDLALARPLVTSPASGAVVLHPGAGFGACRWPGERFASVARELATDRRVVVTGADSERDLAESVAREAGLPEDAVLAGKTGLMDLAALVAGAALVVCGDTGVGHLATAYGTPSVVLFGPASPDRWGPPPARRDRHVVLWAGEEGDPFASEPHPGLLRIKPEEVLAAASRVLR